MFSKNQLENTFFDMVNKAKMGYYILFDDFVYLRFDYIENNIKDDSELNDDEFYGKDDIKSDYTSIPNASIGFTPTLVVNNRKDFIDKLFVYCILSYNKYEDYFKPLMKKSDQKSLIASLIISLFSNATYEEYRNPVDYIERQINFITDTTLNNYNNTLISNNCVSLLNSSIECSVKRDTFGYETPYIFETKIVDNSYEYYLPIINYGIDNGVCYIYSIQNKMQNEDNDFTKKIKRLLNKANANVASFDEEYETIKDVAPSFVIAFNIFMDILKNNNINYIRIINLMPDRYLEKESNDIVNADNIQHRISNKLILLSYRMKHHYEDIEVNYPIFDLYYNGHDDPGNDLFIDINNKGTCLNNQLLNEIDTCICHKKRVLR